MATEASTETVVRLLRSDGTPAAPVERDGCVAVFDGVVHERGRLARELGSRSEEPAELLLAAYLRWGEDAVHHISGTFAWAVWDGRSEKLFAARDQVGIWPLFYADGDTGLILSSSLEGLLAQPGVSNDVHLL